MSDSPLASVIINNYNYGRFLGEAIESALAQTYANTEVIVVDDGSTDDSRQVIESFGKRILAVFKENGGQGSAYNAGFRVCAGDAVCFLDADDALLSTAVETAIAAMDEPEVVKVQWPLRVVNAAGDWQGELSISRKPPDGDLRAQVVEEGPIYDFYFTMGSMYRRWFLESVVPVPEASYRNGGDVYFISLAPAFGLIRTACEPLGTYRAHGSNNYRDRLLDVARVENCIDRFEANAHHLRLQLAKQGVSIELKQWRRRNFNYLWPHRLLLARGDLETAIPRGERYLLVDNDEWGLEEPLPERMAIPFLERDGRYWGPPSDDRAAIGELHRQRGLGVRFLAIWWTCFWWSEAYPEFTKYVHGQFDCLLNNDRLLLFDLSGSSSAGR